MIYPRTKVYQRRREVTSLMVRGFSPSEIAEVLKVTRHTIYNDVRVIRSGKYDALIAHTRAEITAQLYLNAMERAKQLWRIIDEGEKGYVKVQALRELRLGDEHILGKLKFMSESEMRQAKEEEALKQRVMSDYTQLLERTRLLGKLRLSMVEEVKEYLDTGREDALRRFLEQSRELTESAQSAE
jgi:hypothetical protein